MLVLSRKEQETIVVRVKGLAEPIRVKVVRVKGDNVRIGVTHPDPDAVRIDREEVDNEIHGRGRALAGAR